MTNRVLELASRVEAATGPDREIDREIMALDYDWKRRALSKGSRFRDKCWVHRATNKWRTTAPDGFEFTTSLDAAMTLVPEGAWWWVEAQPLGTAFLAGAGDERVSTAATPALALCAAALKAIAGREG
jgi:hypothetical protein